MIHEFGTELLKWFGDGKRELPWKGTKDPYLIIVSEFMLQQTQVSKVIPYFKRFTSRFPDFKSLAKSSEDEVLALWQGLGYYSRARNLHHLAREVMDAHHGVFPKEFHAVRALPGIGEYTSAAVLSFAFDQPLPVLDGNVFRVISRYFDISEPIDRSAGRKIIKHHLDEVFDKRRSADFNQAIMDLGSMVCKPRSPQCDSCPLSLQCLAFQYKKQLERPVKSRKIVVKDRFLNFVIFREGNMLFMGKRPKGKIWAGLYDFPMLESEKINYNHDGILQEVGQKVKQESELIVHKLTHQKLHVKFFHIDGNPPEIMQKNRGWYAIDELDSLPLPILISRYLKENLNFIF